MVILTTFEQCTNVFFFFFNEWTAIKIYIYIYIFYLFFMNGIKNYSIGNSIYTNLLTLS